MLVDLTPALQWPNTAVAVVVAVVVARILTAVNKVAPF
jgi:hypothetical protein